MDTKNNILTPEEIALAEKALRMAQEAGASKCRMTLSKSVLDLVGTLNGELDKVQHCLDRSLSMALFVDGRYGTFSTNRLEETELAAFLDKAVETVRMLTEDPYRALPAQERVAKDAVNGDEAGTWDPEGYASVTPEWLVETALSDAWFGRHAADGFEMVSEEGELSVTASESLVLDSDGTRCRSRESLFEYGVETTVRCLASGEKVSGYWWDSRPRLQDLDHAACGKTAAERAVAAAGAEPLPVGRYTMAVSTECAGKLVTPILNALGGYALQQKNSFLVDQVGKSVFSENLTLLDQPRVPGINGARLYDSEGVATTNCPIIENGVIKTCFLNTYMAAKLGLPPTIEDAMRPVLLPTHPGLRLDQWLTTLAAADKGSTVQRMCPPPDTAPLGQMSPRGDNMGEEATSRLAGRGPLDTSYRETMTKETMGGAVANDGAEGPDGSGVPLHGATFGAEATIVVVEGFNGGNHNPATGDFSYGIEGRAFVDGQWRPVKEMLITGNFLTLWKNLVAVFDDARPCSPKSLPGLLFNNVDFSG